MQTAGCKLDEINVEVRDSVRKALTLKIHLDKHIDERGDGDGLEQIYIGTIKTDLGNRHCSCLEY